MWADWSYSISIFFVIHQFQSPKWMLYSFFFFLLSLCRGPWYFEGTCVFWEWWILQVWRGGKKKRAWHSRHLTRPVKVLRLSHYQRRSVKTRSSTLLIRLGLPRLRLLLEQSDVYLCLRLIIKHHVHFLCFILPLYIFNCDWISQKQIAISVTEEN